MTLRGYVFCVNGEVEGEGEERDDDQVDETDAHSWRSHRRSKGSKIECRESDSG